MLVFLCSDTSEIKAGFHQLISIVSVENFSTSTCDHIELPGIVYWPDGQVRLGVTAMKNDQSPKNKYIEEWRP